MKYKPSRLPLILTSLIGGVVLMASSGVYAGNDAYLHSSPSLAADEEQASGEFQYTLISFLEDELDRANSGAWEDDNGQLKDENVVLEDKSVDDSQDSNSTPGVGVGMGVTPMFDKYGVIRASTSHNKSTYLALGFISEEWTMDEADTSDSRDQNELSYGFGVNSASSNFEYMMSVDQEDKGVSAVGMKFTSEF